METTNQCSYSLVYIARSLNTHDPHSLRQSQEDRNWVLSTFSANRDNIFYNPTKYTLERFASTHTGRLIWHAHERLNNISIARGQLMDCHSSHHNVKVFLCLVSINIWLSVRCSANYFLTDWSRIFKTNNWIKALYAILLAVHCTKSDN